MPSMLERWGPSLLDSRRPIVRQVPTAVLFAGIGFLNLLDPDVVVGSDQAVQVAGVIVFVATVLAVAFSIATVPQRVSHIIPSLDFVAVGVLLITSPIGTSSYIVLLILPVFWLAGAPGRRYIVYSLLGVVMVALLPLIIGIPIAETPAEGFRALFAAAIFAVAALAINELSRQARLRAQAQRELAERREAALAEGIVQARKLAESEARLQISNARFREVWQAVTEQAVIGTNLEGLIDAWNVGATKMLGYSEEEADGNLSISRFFDVEEVLDRMSGSPDATSLSVIVANADSGEPGEWTLQSRDGTLVPVEVSVTTRLSPAGQPTGYLLVAHDVSRVREVIRLKDEFIGLVSHELRTPVSSIIGYVDLLREENDDPGAAEERLRYLEVIERNGNRLIRLVTDLLLAAQVEAGVDHLATSATDLAELVGLSIESLTPRIHSSGLSIRLDLAPGLIVRADPTRMSQAIENLLTNAIKFTPAGGEVSVSLVKINDCARITVADSGIGIPEEEIDQLFGRFFRASTAVQGAIPGIGLGLNIVNAIVRAHDGSINVFSTVGEGTSFVIDLPLLARP